MKYQKCYGPVTKAKSKQDFGHPVNLHRESLKNGFLFVSVQNTTLFQFSISVYCNFKLPIYTIKQERCMQIKRVWS